MELTSLGFTPGSHDPIRTALARRIMRWRTSARAIPSFSVSLPYRWSVLADHRAELGGLAVDRSPRPSFKTLKMERRTALAGVGESPALAENVQPGTPQSQPSGVWLWGSLPASRGNCVTAQLLCQTMVTLASSRRVPHLSRVDQEVLALNKPCGNSCARPGACAGWWFLPRRHPQLASYLGRIPSELA